MSITISTATVGERLRLAREARGLTLKQVAEATTYAETSISGVENGQHKPSVRFIQDMVMALGLNMHWLIVGHGEMFDPGAASSSKALLLDTLESLMTEYAALKEELGVAASRSGAIEARIEDLERLIKGEVKVAQKDPAGSIKGRKR